MTFRVKRRIVTIPPSVISAECYFRRVLFPPVGVVSGVSLSVITDMRHRLRWGVVCFDGSVCEKTGK